MKKSKYMIQVYTAFVTATHLYVKGRVLKDKSPISFVDQGPMSSLFNTILRVRSRELPNTPIQCEFGNHTFEVVTDDEGYFEIFHNISEFQTITKSITLHGDLKGDHITFNRALRAYQYDVPHGIISDIDDTILVSRVRSFFRWKLLFNTVFVNPFRRKPIEHAAEALHSMLSSLEGQSPMIYLSNSPWNIFDYLQAFLLHNVFPIGELILRDMGIQLLKSREIEEYNKYMEIEKLLMAFGETTFILIGDTGEMDFDIYTAILKKYPGRIERIILRDDGNKKKLEVIQQYIKNQSEPKVEVVDGYEKLF